MVDTINPNTSQPDSWGDSPAPAAAVPSGTPEDRFFGGFDQPGDTKINLADGQSQQAAPTFVEAPQAPVQPEPIPVQSQPAPQAVSDVAAPVQPAEVKHTTYTNTADMINWRGILVIVAIGLVSTMILGLGLYFGLGALNSSKLKTQQDQLSSLEGQLSALKTTPNPLELPVTETPSTTEESTPVTTPVVAPVETPITTPATLPSANDDKLG